MDSFATWALRGLVEKLSSEIEDILACLLRGDDFTMVRRTTDAPLGELDKERNKLISKLRSPGERPHAVIKRVFAAGRVLVTTVRRVHIKMMVTAFALDLYQLCTLKNAKAIYQWRKLSTNNKKYDRFQKEMDIVA